jgi:glycosyltransferase involved in cell wall biosynthesis
MFAGNLLKYKGMFGLTPAETLLDANDNIQLTGWPMEYLQETLVPYKNMEKKDTIVFPHRIAPEKQVDIFKDLAKELPEYEFIVCQEKQLTKNEYHNILGEAKIVFSANLQETLGISAYEGALTGAIPMVPDRLSYTEMYDEDFKYPSEWTESFESYAKHKSKLIEKLKNYMQNHKNYHNQLNTESAKLTQKFFSGNNMYDSITKSDTPL